ncbi:MAG: hypothetical protein SangKO_010270 [Sandaracinaceae bacterium]|nr:hypothetical protein [Myxococcales bacterium]
MSGERRGIKKPGAPPYPRDVWTPDEHGMKGRIFVAGTGRSGTTRLAWLLGKHPEVWAVPTEARFLIDPDGLEDLVSALTDRYSFYHADQAVKRFDALMRHTLTGRTETVFRNWYLDQHFGEARWYRALNAMMSQLVAIDFDENVPCDRWTGTHAQHWPSQQKRHRRTIGRFFPEREPLLALCRELIDTLFASAAREAGKSFWCEKTPLNLLSMPFLWELYPDALVVHVKRDPRGVAHSLRKQWGFAEIDQALDMLEPYYVRWARFRESGYDLSTRRYLELAVEDIAAAPAAAMRAILFSVGASRADYPDDSYSLDRTNAWQREMEPADRRRCEERLAPYFGLMGYDIEPRLAEAATPA